MKLSAGMWAGLVRIVASVRIMNGCVKRGGLDLRRNDAFNSQAHSCCLTFFRKFLIASCAQYEKNDRLPALNEDKIHAASGPRPEHDSRLITEEEESYAPQHW